MAMIVAVSRDKYDDMYAYYKLLKDYPCKKCDRTYRGFCTGCKEERDYQNKVSSFKHLDNDSDKKTLFRFFRVERRTGRIGK